MTLAILLETKKEKNKGKREIGDRKKAAYLLQINIYSTSHYLFDEFP